MKYLDFMIKCERIPKSFPFLFSLLFFISVSGNSQTPETQFQNANNLFQSKKYEQAAEIYENLIQAGNQSAELHLNLGNSYFRTNNLGRAILHYERALIINPDLEDARYNLKIANQKQRNELETIQPFFLKKQWETLRQCCSEGTWSFFGLMMLWLGIGGLAVWFLANERTQRKKGFIIGIVLIILSILPFSLASSRAKFEHSSGKAILLEKSIALKSGPDEASTDIIQIYEGLKMDLLDKIGEWHKVKLSNGEQGWLHEGSFEEI